ncbi:glycine zipper family protein [Shewanella eurypsychrophilus]|uniref:Glycine zipper family protein n=1 Tax=Shewanella eurypsychrophilus TaxID=2593656 RepID=A0ABX6V666_9GAMM|nr:MULTISPECIES: glycine zipper family protein [Shewanella]QFU22821.1 glycine zipper family protein [Shewanella sp. YLB-09]QPG58108.1 glycine zipper family protein [Shewanella eurypsychrophilus]
MKKAFLLVGLLVLHTSASASNVIIDKSGVDEKDYIFDMHECTELSQQAQKKQTEGGLVSGAAKGAALGAAAGAISGGSGTDGAKTGAAIGVVGGALGRNRSKRQNEASHEAEKQTVVKNCMINRGYTVLN